MGGDIFEKTAQARETYNQALEEEENILSDVVAIPFAIYYNEEVVADDFRLDYNINPAELYTQYKKVTFESTSDYSANITIEFSDRLKILTTASLETDAETGDTRIWMGNETAVLDGNVVDIDDLKIIENSQYTSMKDYCRRFLEKLDTEFVVKLIRGE